ncbi:sugar ABC transporter substrate-binding protein [Oscillospiraceae bacterium PP1C4]
MRKILAGLLAGSMVLSLAACGGSKGASSAAASQTPTSSAAASESNSTTQKKVAVIRNLTSDDHTKQFLQGCVSEGESFGYKVDTFISDGDDAKMQTLVEQAIQKDYDGLIISHGKADYSYDLLKPAIDKGIKVVTFDTVAEKDGKQLEGITSTAQDDQKLAELSLGELANLGKDGKPARIIKVWFGPGIPPLDKRNIIYQQLEKEGKIVTVENIGPSNLQNTQGDVANGVSAILPKYKEGEVDGIWGSWDELAKGALTALKDAGRTDIPLISIDISNQDINLMREQPDVWRATAAVDPRLIGIVDMRLLAKKFKGEETPATYNLEAKLIKAEALKPDTSMDTLKTIVEGWGVSDAFNEPWMDELRAAKK